MNNPKILISGGGTGGHIFPALAIAGEIKRRYPNADILLLVPITAWKWRKILLLAISSLAFL